jgi:hypothetical protein
VLHHGHVILTSHTRKSAVVTGSYQGTPSGVPFGVEVESGFSRWVFPAAAKAACSAIFRHR